MSAIVRIQDYRRKPPYQHFTRSELNRLLGLYASRVIKGEWRDYAISIAPDAARFMIFNRAQENPQFVISKLEKDKRGLSSRHGRYVVTSRECKLKQGNSLDDVLGIFERPLALVK
jgi:hypothetical protein